jgi:glc operon protein GlcG
MRTKHCLTLDDAHRMMAAAKQEALRSGWLVSISIVDDSGFVVLLERLDGANAKSPEIATLKAATAALTRKPTRELEGMVALRPVMTTFPGRLPVIGGLPIFHQGECVGGIGVSGVKSQEDELVAKAGLKALD